MPNSQTAIDCQRGTVLSSSLSNQRMRLQEGGQMGTKKQKTKIWSCKIGWVPEIALAAGADLPMRRAIEEAFYKVTGVHCKFIFSGWGAELTEGELMCLTKKEHPDGLRV